MLTSRLTSELISDSKDTSTLSFLEIGLPFSSGGRNSHSWTISTAFWSNPIPSPRSTFILRAIPSMPTFTDTTTAPWTLAFRASIVHSGSGANKTMGLLLP
jgi:hypothetical protein